MSGPSNIHNTAYVGGTKKMYLTEAALTLTAYAPSVCFFNAEDDVLVAIGTSAFFNHAEDYPTAVTFGTHAMGPLVGMAELEIEDYVISAFKQLKYTDVCESGMRTEVVLHVSAKEKLSDMLWACSVAVSLILSQPDYDRALAEVQGAQESIAAGKLAAAVRAEQQARAPRH